tara:strand:- start:836 stop:1684 length:849 start_codon:yes stop_codon:yes gene_type:complete
MMRGVGVRAVLLVLTLGLASLPAAAGSRLVGTGGVSAIEGAAGGGLSPWAVLTGTASEGEFAVTAAATRADLSDYRLDVRGVAINLHDRLELSAARQDLRLDTLGGRLRQDVYGAKLRMFGDLVYHPLGVWSVGVQHKRLRDRDLPRAVGARDTRGTDVYLAGSKLFFDVIAGRNVLANLTLRSTRANQGGLLGFGGDEESGRSLVAEASLAVMLTPRWVVGVEFRQKPDNLGFAREDHWRDVFTAYFFNKHVSLTGAWLDLGSIAGLRNQRGGYVSLQVAF